jgi:hypothetical protein
MGGWEVSGGVHPRPPREGPLAAVQGYSSTTRRHANPPPPFARTTPLSEQHEVLVLQLLELLNLAVLFSGCL